MAHSTAFSRFWLERFPTDSAPDGRWLVGVREDLTHAIQTILTLDGRRLVAATPAFAARAGLVDGARLDDDALAGAVARAGARLNGPDHIFGFDDDHLPRLMGEENAASIRPLGPADADRFARLTGACSPSEVDEAYVEVDHWAAFGLFDGDEIVSAASAYPWRTRWWPTSASSPAPIAVAGVTPGRWCGRSAGTSSMRGTSRSTAAGWTTSPPQRPRDAPQ